MSSDSDDKKPAKEKTIVEPFHVVAAGSGIICAGKSHVSKILLANITAAILWRVRVAHAVALLTGTLTYRAGTKE